MIRETGFLDGLYTAEELDSNNVKDKDSKIAFLEKLIAAVSMYRCKVSQISIKYYQDKIRLQCIIIVTETTSDINISVRPAKIVAGLEVNKTLELLRALGQAIDNKVSEVTICCLLRDTECRNCILKKIL